MLLLFLIGAMQEQERPEPRYANPAVDVDAYRAMAHSQPRIGIAVANFG